MTEQDIRDKAAQLIREIRAIHRKGDWSLKAWNDQARSAARHYITSTRRFLRANAE